MLGELCRIIVAVVVVERLGKQGDKGVVRRFSRDS
jgi:hypothetical protein